MNYLNDGSFLLENDFCSLLSSSENSIAGEMWDPPLIVDRVQVLTPPYESSKSDCDENSATGELFAELCDLPLSELNRQSSYESFLSIPPSANVNSPTAGSEHSVSLSDGGQEKLNYNFHSLSETNITKKNPCMSKNAKTARRNREKKKNYMQELENDVKTLRTDKESLCIKVNKLESTVEDLKQEVDYLRSVLAHESELSQLLNIVAKAPGITLVKPQLKGVKRKLGLSHDDHNYPKQGKLDTTDSLEGNSSVSPGVCLHVSDGKLSFEVCSMCNETHSTHGCNS
ncbi:unnamed protein product [Clavelina lepadiformis]|uniref:BZIP domain-containing protein n=1 Tax=Clavelina lepadiformis TaxID=159417 RepID=A0ABP0GUB9_CLALP